MFIAELEDIREFKRRLALAESRAAELQAAEQALRESKVALRDELAHKTRLHDLTERLNLIPDLPTALGEVLDAAILQYGADKGTIQYYDPAKDVLRYIATGGDQQLLSTVHLINRNFIPPVLCHSDGTTSGCRGYRFRPSMGRPRLPR